MRWKQTHLSVASLCVLAFLIVSPGDSGAYGDSPNFADGEQIFRHTWKHQSAEQPTQIGKQPVQIRQIISQLSQGPGDGLGPMHNATSCESCHAHGGASGIERNVTLLTLDPRNAFLNGRFRGSDEVRDALLELYPGLISSAGVLSMDVVIHEKSARPFYQPIREGILQSIPGSIPDGWYDSNRRTVESVAQQPVLAGRKGSIDFYLSQRNSPPLFGLGLIDLIEDSQLNQIARAQARRSNGQISGRVGVGKFGWRGQTTSLDAFVRGACAGELGLQVTRTPQPSDAADETYASFGLDLNEKQVGMLVSYIRDLPSPRMETHLPTDRAEIREGKALFAKVGCAACHVENVLPARGIYSDLLLHDMGSLLQAPAPAPLGRSLASASRLAIPRFSRDNPLSPNGIPFSTGGYYGSPSSATPIPYRIGRPAEPQFPRGKVPSSVYETTNANEATWDLLQREWRTPPLWGVADSAPYLHDGRAATLDAAIRWHAGEASHAATKYRTLPPDAREKIITFLASLRAPAESIRQSVDRSVESHYVLTSDNTQLELDAAVEDIDVFSPF
ncbi:MAG: di-heme oxidoredictase family protein [Planctomycetota bacterium]